MFIDTHTHLYLPEFQENGSGEAAVMRAIDAGVRHMVFPNIDCASISPMRELAALFPDNISMAMGLHPTEVKDSWRDDTAAILDELARGDYKALGEVGIDLYWDKTYEQQQMQCLEQQLLKARDMDLPVIIHCREGLPQTLEVIAGVPGTRAVFHSFGGSADDVEAIRRVGDFFFGINGIVTFKNCALRNVLPAITVDRILLETDSPYLAPVPNRGKRNESAYIPLIAAHIAQNLDIPLPSLADKTTASAISFFNLTK